MAHISRIGRARGYKAEELAKFTVGQTLLIGGKEVEVWLIVEFEKHVRTSFMTIP